VDKGIKEGPVVVGPVLILTTGSLRGIELG
jgi:hypothetical protein